MRAINATLNPNVIPECEKFPRLSDEFWACLARHYTQTIYHPAGTAKMGPESDPLAVVNPQLQVHGVGNLRVIDCSIMPTIVSGNTNIPTVMIAEKGADMVKQKHLGTLDVPSYNYVPNYRPRENFNNINNNDNKIHPQ
jgi:choline dehydrogenase-like flavoprotein